MLVSDRNGDLLPDWAFFAQAVVDGAQLTPTASREDLYQDDVLAEVRTALGDQIRCGWPPDCGWPYAASPRGHPHDDG